MAGNCVTLWVGAPLGPVERACLRSVLRQGHQVALYSYSRAVSVPRGVELRDANEILPQDRIFFHRTGSVAAFSDWFRCELLRRELGTWVDTDVYLLQPLDGTRPYLFGKEDPKLINNAILRLPAESELIAMLLNVFEKREVPKWIPVRAYVPARLRQLVYGRVDLARLPFGSTGPDALTAAASRLGLSGEALPIDVFNPVPWQRANWIVDSTVSVESVTTGRTVALHLWNHCIRDFKNNPAPRGSFLSRLHTEGYE